MIAVRGGRGTNLALGGVLGAAFVSGVLAFGLGRPWAGWVVLAHGAAGLAVVVLSPGKGAISARGVRRRGPRSTPSLALGSLVVAVVASGVAHALGLRSLGPVSTMQVHVATAILSLPLLAWHVVARPIRVRATDVSRRRLLQGAGVLAGGVGLWAGGRVVAGAFGLPGADRRFTGSLHVGSFDPASLPATSWLNDRDPALDARSHVVVVQGRSWSVGSLDASDEARATLDCTGGWYSTHDWVGIALERVLPAVAGRSVVIRSATGYQRRFPIDDVGRLLLATRIDGAVLPGEHGGPVRLVAPGRRGFWWVKWVSSIQIEDTPWWWQPPFPLA